jgi:F-type H+-transporting ATPase subunit delta
MTKAIVTTAIALSAKQRETIRQELAAKLKEKSVELIEVVDPEIIGGLKIRIGSQELDGSFKTKLDQIRTHLTANV